jgi:hypothetical protein
MTDSALIPVAIESTKMLFGTEDALEGEMMLLEWLEEKVQYMLEQDFNALVNLLYRIDVYESKAKECFGKQNREIAKCLAGLIWERQLQKAKNRRGDR